MLIDSHGRKVSYLRLSITDRCNLRCLYCRPAAEWTFLPHEQILSFEEMAELVDVARLAGVEKVRLTGGALCPQGLHSLRGASAWKVPGS